MKIATLNHKLLKQWKCMLENVELKTLNVDFAIVKLRPQKKQNYLLRCEVFECDICEERTMKTHIEIEHGGNKKLYHIKMNRDDPLKVDFKEYNSDKV